MTAAKKLESVSDEEDSTPGFTFTPKDGDTIVFPTFRSVIVDKAFLWKIHKMSFLSQTWEWMDLAGISDEVQAQVVVLPDDDYAQLFEQWWSEAGVSAGE